MPPQLTDHPHHLPSVPERLYQQVILSLLRAFEHHKSDTSCHAFCVTLFTIHLATHLTEDISLDSIFWGALFHDIGKIAVPRHILQKREPLTPEEWEIIKIHPVTGYNLLKQVALPKEARNMILYHHERWDGRGYPHRLAANEIPLEARICAIADAFEAMTADRPYRSTLTYEAALQELKNNAGSQFDPRLVSVFLQIDPGDWTALRQQASRLILP